MLSDMPLYATIPVKDLRKSMDFYGKTLGMDVIDDDENGVWFRSGNTRFAIYETDMAGTNKTPAAIWLVHQPETLINALTARGIEFERQTNTKIKISKRDARILQTKVKAAWFRDPSGNIICIAGYR